MKKTKNILRLVLVVLLVMTVMMMSACFGGTDPKPDDGDKTGDNTGENTTPEKPKTYPQVSVMSCNLDQASGALTTQQGLILDKIVDFFPDLLGVQEETNAWLNFLKPNLEAEGYEHIYKFRGNPPYDEASGIFYKIDRFTVKQSGTFWMSSTPNTAGSMNSSLGMLYPRVCTWAVLTDKKSGEDIGFFNTHLSYETTAARQFSINLITERIAALGVPSFFCGDLNFSADLTYHSKAEPATYALLTNTLVDSRIAAPETMNGPTFQEYGAAVGDTTDKYAQSPIDYIFTTKDYFVAKKFAIQTESGPIYSSDHFSITATYDYPSKEA